MPSAVRCTDCLFILVPDPTDESVGYCHSSAARTNRTTFAQNPYKALETAMANTFESDSAAILVTAFRRLAQANRQYEKALRVVRSHSLDSDAWDCC